jgi:hypothetical protein
MVTLCHIPPRSRCCDFTPKGLRFYAARLATLAAVAEVRQAVSELTRHCALTIGVTK